MARYRTKDETDLVWNATRRRITRDLDTAIQDFREPLLDRLLTAAWERHVAALETGSLVQLEDTASKWIDELLRDKLLPAIEAMNGDLADA